MVSKYVEKSKDPSKLANEPVNEIPADIKGKAVVNGSDDGLRLTGKVPYVLEQMNLCDRERLASRMNQQQHEEDSQSVDTVFDESLHFGNNTENVVSADSISPATDSHVGSSFVPNSVSKIASAGISPQGTADTTPHRDAQLNTGIAASSLHTPSLSEQLDGDNFVPNSVSTQQPDIPADGNHAVAKDLRIVGRLWSEEVEDVSSSQVQGENQEEPFVKVQSKSQRKKQKRDRRHAQRFSQYQSQYETESVSLEF